MVEAVGDSVKCDHFCFDIEDFRVHDTRGRLTVRNTSILGEPKVVRASFTSFFLVSHNAVYAPKCGRVSFGRSRAGDGISYRTKTMSPNLVKSGAGGFLRERYGFMWAK